MCERERERENKIAREKHNERGHASISWTNGFRGQLYICLPAISLCEPGGPSIFFLIGFSWVLSLATKMQSL